MSARVRPSREGFYLVVTTSVLGFSDCLSRALQMFCLLSSSTTTNGPGPPFRFPKLQFSFRKMVMILILIILTTASTTAYNVDHSSLLGIRFRFGPNLHPAYQYLSGYMNASSTDTFTEDEINTLYDDGSTRKSMDPTAFKKLKEVAVKKISDKATLTTDKTDLKTKIFMSPFYYMDQHGTEHFLRTHMDLGKAIKRHLAHPHASLAFYENEFVFYISTVMLSRQERLYH